MRQLQSAPTHKQSSGRLATWVLLSFLGQALSTRVQRSATKATPETPYTALSGLPDVDCGSVIAKQREWQLSEERQALTSKFFALMDKGMYSPFLPLSPALWCPCNRCRANDCGNASKNSVTAMWKHNNPQGMIFAAPPEIMYTWRQYKFIGEQSEAARSAKEDAFIQEELERKKFALNDELYSLIAGAPQILLLPA